MNKRLNGESRERIALQTSNITLQNTVVHISQQPAANKSRLERVRRRQADKDNKHRLEMNKMKEENVNLAEDIRNDVQGLFKDHKDLAAELRAEMEDMKKQHEREILKMRKMHEREVEQVMGERDRDIAAEKRRRRDQNDRFDTIVDGLQVQIDEFLEDSADSDVRVSFFASRLKTCQGLDQR